MRRPGAKGPAAMLAAFAAAAVLTVAWAAIATWCQHFFGFANGDGNGSHYLFFSGSGSDLAYLSVAWSVAMHAAVYYHVHRCHEPRCPWIGHLMADGHTRSCWHHHPEGRPAPGHIRRAHDRHLASRHGG